MLKGPASVLYGQGSLGSYSRAFNPVTGATFEGSAFQPERGTQYEVGVKNLFDVDYFESAVSRLFVFTGEPFTVQGTISVNF